ncbi:Electron transfer flavoprotein beta subunit lysine methyltransferase, partial [Halocaridina rubra]
MRIISQPRKFVRRCLSFATFQTHQHNILAETEPSRDHLTPELELHLITERCRLWTAHPQDSPFSEPYWAFYWPGGQAVSRYLIDNKHLVKGKNVLDFGCGCGASGLSAKLSGAKHVMFNDIDKIAIEAVVLNGLNNNINIDAVSTSSLIGTCCKEYAVVTVGDMFYDTHFANEVFRWLIDAHERGSFVLIGDPGRFALKSHPLKSSLMCLAKYELKPST